MLNWSSACMYKVNHGILTADMAHNQTCNKKLFKKLNACKYARNLRKKRKIGKIVVCAPETAVDLDWIRHHII